MRGENGERFPRVRLGVRVRVRHTRAHTRAHTHPPCNAASTTPEAATSYLRVQNIIITKNIQIKK